MPYAPFYEKFPDLGKRETRSIAVFNHDSLPDDEYGLIEAYCNEENCDCRRVLFNVYSKRTQQLEAVIAYGWASKKHYAEWFGEYDPDIIKELQGPCLNSASYQSENASELLSLVATVLNDKKYVNRLKEHYRMFRQTIDAEESEKRYVKREPVTKRIGRNALCPCGSGKKYKRCCGKA